MPKSLNHASVAAISNIGAKVRSGSNYTPPKDKPVKHRTLNASAVERKDSHHTADHSVRNHYGDQLIALVGDRQIPAVRYKGAVIPRRVLSDFSYLTHA